MSSPTATRDAAAISAWWYGRGNMLCAVRHLEKLANTDPAPPIVGAVTVTRDKLDVSFVSPPARALPAPWQMKKSGAMIAWDDISGIDDAPTGQVRVPVVTFGTVPDGALLGLNLDAFARIHVTGATDTAETLIRRWVYELVASHPTVRVGVTEDFWGEPILARIVRVSSVRAAVGLDVLILGRATSYADRAHIAAATASPIIIDLGEDFAVNPTWTIDCTDTGQATIANSEGMSLAVTVPSTSSAMIEQCRTLLTTATPRPQAGTLAGRDRHTEVQAAATAEIASEADLDEELAGHDHDDSDPGDDEFFSPTPPSGDTTDADNATDAIESAIAPPPANPVVAAAVSTDHQPQQSYVPTIWNRILGDIKLCPPNGGKDTDREKLMNELTVLLQSAGRRGLSAEEIVKMVWGEAEQKGLNSRMSTLRTRLGPVASGQLALPHVKDTGGVFRLDSEVMSDWMVFDTLVHIIPSRSSDADLVAALNLITGRPLQTVATTEWAHANELREQIRDRIPAAAHTLASRQLQRREYDWAITTAEKGIWYDDQRQDLWELLATAAADSHNISALREFRGQYFTAVSSAERKPGLPELFERG